VTTGPSSDADLTARLAEVLTDDVLVPVERGPVIDALLPVVREYGDQRAAEACGNLAEEIATLIAGRMHLGPTSLGRLSALLDVGRDPGLLEEAGRGT
jgi:hypothetical protein